MDRQL
jgi:hypothetical protein